MAKEQRPEIKLEFQSFDLILEGLALMGTIALVVLPLIHLHQLPDEIPTHFNASGTPDGYGSKMTLWLLPLIGIGQYVLLTFIARYPQSYNYPVKITGENAVRQYLIAVRMIRMLKAIIAVIFTFITYKMIATALGETEGLGSYFIVVFLVAVFGPIGYYFVRAGRKA
ncbi:MAG: DUF1648 domain-containing protein [Saprospiraceae bacterium]